MTQHNGRNIDESRCHFCGEQLTEDALWFEAAPGTVVGYCCEECEQSDFNNAHPFVHES